MASVLNVQALQKGPCGANQIAYTDIGSADKLSEQGLIYLRNMANCQQNTALLVATQPNSTCLNCFFSTWR